MLTIGAVRNLLAAEFPDISISKIRYLESQGLLTPKPHAIAATGSSARPTSSACTDSRAAARRVPAAARHSRGARHRSHRSERRRRSLARSDARGRDRPERALRGARSSPRDSPRARGAGSATTALEAGERFYGESEPEIAHVCARIAAHGVDARHLRAFKHASDRVSGLVEQITAPALHPITLNAAEPRSPTSRL